MSFALNEVEAMARKAARGAGYSWGMADEAGRAARWLCAHGIDGVAALTKVLTRADGQDTSRMAPRTLRGDWRAEAAQICPLMAGAALSDSVFDWAGADKRIENIIAPIMLLPFAAYAARQLAGTVTIEWTGVRVVTDGSDASLKLDDQSSLLDPAGLVSVRTGDRLEHPRPVQDRARPDEADWAVLNRFAHRIYVPDTEQSRLKGAGAGLTDND